MAELLYFSMWVHRTLVRTTHSANQFSIYRAVSSWYEEFGQKSNEKESTSERFVAKENEQLLKNVKAQVNSVVQIPRNDNRASGNRLKQNYQFHATIQGQTMVGPVLQVHISRYLSISGIDPRRRKSELLGC